MVMSPVGMSISALPSSGVVDDSDSCGADFAAGDGEGGCRAWGLPADACLPGSLVQGVKDGCPNGAARQASLPDGDVLPGPGTAGLADFDLFSDEKRWGDNDSGAYVCADVKDDGARATGRRRC